MERELFASGKGEAASPEGLDRAWGVVVLVSAAFAVRPEEIGGPHRGSKQAAFARQVAMYLVHTRLGLSYAAAGSLFGRDRTTAAHACQTVEDRREDFRIDGIVDCLERTIERLPWPGGMGGAAL